MTPVDAYLDQHVRPPYRGLAERLRALMREAAPQATEQMAYGLPMWKGAGWLAYLSPSQRGLTVGFPYGASFADPHDVLRGTGIHARHIKLRRDGEVPDEILRAYIAQAVAADAGAP